VGERHQRRSDLPDTVQRLTGGRRQIELLHFDKIFRGRPSAAARIAVFGHFKIVTVLTFESGNGGSR